MTLPSCELCSRPLPDQAYVCSTDTAWVREDLERIIGLAPEVEATVAKLVSFGGQLTAGSGERPLPFDPKAAERAEALKGELATWAKHVAGERGLEIPRAAGELGAVVAARFLAENLEWLRHRQEAAEAFTALRSVARQLEGLVGRPPELRYRGPCWADLGELDEVGDPLRCQEILYVRPDSDIVKCRFCGTEHDAARRREWLLSEARSTLAHAALISSALTALDLPVAVGTIYSWASRGRLVDHGKDGLGRPLYRVGDAIDLLIETKRRVA